MNDFKPRFNLRFALAWRAVAELFRRHRSRIDLRVNHLHPALSTGGKIIITDGPLLVPPALQGPRPAIFIACGGDSASGALECLPFSPAARVVDAEVRDPSASYNVFHALLQAPSPRTVIDEIEARAGLPTVDHLPAMDRPTFVARVIAGFMEHQAMSPVDWRPSCGWYDTSAAGCSVASWVRAFPDEWRSLQDRVTDENRHILSRASGRFWLLARNSQEHAPCRELDPHAGPAMVLDMATGRASLANVEKPPFDLWAYCQSRGGGVGEAVRWVEDRVESKG